MSTQNENSDHMIAVPFSKGEETLSFRGDDIWAATTFLVRPKEKVIVSKTIKKQIGKFSYDCNVTLRLAEILDVPSLYIVGFKMEQTSFSLPKSLRTVQDVISNPTLYGKGSNEKIEPIPQLPLPKAKKMAEECYKELEGREITPGDLHSGNIYLDLFVEAI